MTKCFVSGYWKSNLGDDLFLKILCERYPDVIFYIFAEKKDSLQFQEYKNVKIIHNNIFFKIFNKLLRSFGIVQLQDILMPIMTQCYIEIGGSIFMEYDGWQYKLKERIFARKKFKKYFIIGSNFGPYNTEEFYMDYKKFFRSIDGIVFRDTYSYNLFEGSNLHKSNDVIFNLGNNSIFQNYPKKKQVMISVVDSSTKVQDGNNVLQIKYENKLVELCDKFVSDGYDIILTSFCEYEGDSVVVDNVYSKITANKGRVHKVKYLNNIEDILKIIAESEKIFAARFHACVLGLVFGCQVLPIAYSNKTKNLIEDLYNRKLWISFEEFIDSKNIDLKFVSLSQSKKEEVCRDADNQFIYLDKFIRHGY